MEWSLIRPFFFSAFLFFNLVDPSVDLPAKVQRLPKSSTITAPQLNSISQTTRIAAKRNRRLLKSGDLVKNAFKTISDPRNSLTLAMTPSDVDNAHRKRQSVGAIIRSFESSVPRQKERRTQRIRNIRAYQKLGAAERRFIQDHGIDHGK